MQSLQNTKFKSFHVISRVWYTSSAVLDTSPAFYLQQYKYKWISLSSAMVLRRSPFGTTYPLFVSWTTSYQQVFVPDHVEVRRSRLYFEGIHLST